MPDIAGFEFAEQIRLVVDDIVVRDPRAHLAIYHSRVYVGGESRGGVAIESRRE